MSRANLSIVLKKEKKSPLASYKDQSLLKRKFGDAAVSLYNAIDSKKTAQELISFFGMKEEQFIEILEFMNNNAMISIAEPSDESAPGAEKNEAQESKADEGEETEGEAEDEPKRGIIRQRESRHTTQEESEDEAKAKSEAEEGEGDAESKTEEEGEGKEQMVREAAARARQPAKITQKKQDDEGVGLSPLEKVLFEKYGKTGVQVYNLIDGERTAEEILGQTGISEAKLVEILEFMDEQGIIKLEKPDEAKPPAVEGEGGAEGEEGKEKEGEAEREPRFKPYIEEEPEGKLIPIPEQKKGNEEEKKKEEEPVEDIVMVDVPEMVKMTMMQKAMTFAELSTKFGKEAKQLVDMIDGNRDFIDLSLSTGMSLFDIDSIMAYFGKKGLIVFKQLGREEIKKKYGEDGFAIYKKYGRDGLLLYEMIGKEASLKDIILKSRMDPDRAIDIFVFIHSVLGLDIPIDRDMIYRQIGMKKSA